MACSFVAGLLLSVALKGVYCSENANAAGELQPRDPYPSGGVSYYPYSVESVYAGPSLIVPSYSGGYYVSASAYASAYPSVYPSGYSSAYVSSFASFYPSAYASAYPSGYGSSYPSAAGSSADSYITAGPRPSPHTGGGQYHPGQNGGFNGGQQSGSGSGPGPAASTSAGGVVSTGAAPSTSPFSNVGGGLFLVVGLLTGMVAFAL